MDNRVKQIMNTQQEAECDKPIRNGMMRDDMKKGRGVKEAVENESRRGSMMEEEGGGQEESLWY